MTLLSRERLAAALASVAVLGPSTPASACMNEMVAHRPALVVPILGVGTLLLHAVSLRRLRTTRQRVVSLVVMTLVALLIAELVGPSTGDGSVVLMIGVMALIVVAHILDGILSGPARPAPAQPGSADDQGVRPAG